MDIIVPDLESAQESSPSICSRILHYCLHFTNGRSSSCTIFFFLAQESCICFHFSMGTSFCCMPFNLLNNSASASILYGQIFLLHPFQSAQESCIIVSISRSVIVSIASILSGQISLLHSLQSAQESCIIASISLLPDLPNCINFNSAQESCTIVSISVWPDLPYCINFNLLNLHITCSSICSRTFAFASNFLWADLPIASSSICSRILHCFKV